MYVDRPSDLRDRSADTARDDWQAALALSEEIADPWFACQSLSHAGEACPDPESRVQILRRAYDQAMRCEDANRQVKVASWPIKVLCVTGSHDVVRELVPQLLTIAATLDSPVRRADALNMLAGAVASGPTDIFDSVLGPLFEACRTPLLGGKRNRRGVSTLVDWIPFLELTRPGEFDHLHDAVLGRTFQRRLEERRTLPREHLADTSWLGPNIAPQHP